MSRGGATTNIDEVETVSVTETVGDIINVQINILVDIWQTGPVDVFS